MERREGHFSIMKVTGGDTERVRIKLRHVDDNQSALFVEASMEDFARALFGEAERPMVGWISGAPPYKQP